MSEVFVKAPASLVKSYNAAVAVLQESLLCNLVECELNDTPPFNADKKKILQDFLVAMHHADGKGYIDYCVNILKFKSLHGSNFDKLHERLIPILNTVQRGLRGTYSSTVERIQFAAMMKRYNRSRHFKCKTPGPVPEQIKKLWLISDLRKAGRIPHTGEFYTFTRFCDFLVRYFEFVKYTRDKEIKLESRATLEALEKEVANIYKLCIEHHHSEVMNFMRLADPSCRFCPAHEVIQSALNGLNSLFYWISTRKRERKKPSKAIHLKWKEWRKEGLSYNAIVLRHHEQTQNYVTRDAVIKAIKRMPE